MEKLLENIDKRVHLQENEGRYNKLCLHTDDVQGGKDFLEKSMKAKRLLDTIKNNKNPKLNYDAQYRHLIQDMVDWLNKNGWA